MKKLLIFVCSLINFCVSAQNTPAVKPKLNTFHIIDSLTKKPVITTIIIARAGLTITTEKDGIFVIPGDLAKMRDTVILNSQGYTVTRLPLTILSMMDTIRLKKNIIQKSIANLNYTKDTVLNDFSRFDVGYYAGISTEIAKFEYLQLAQKFTVPKAGIRLITVDVIRLAYNNTDPSLMVQNTKYHLRFYDINPKTGGPGRDLCNEVVEVSNNDDQQNKVDLRKYTITVPGKAFFIAVEWMQDYYNAGYSRYTDAKTKKQVIVPTYKPAIGISPVIGKEINIWALNFKNEWKPFTYFMPFGTDLAMSATIAY